jgi:hypothetical protein
MWANEEALRIWTTVPRKEWATAVLEIPERKEVCSVMWQMRAAVRNRLQMALSANRAGLSYMGMTAENRYAASDGLERESGDD